MKTFGAAGVGLFVAPTAVEEEIRQRYGAEIVGRVEGVRERFYAVTVQRKLKHPAVEAILEQARAGLALLDGME